MLKEEHTPMIPMPATPEERNGSTTNLPKNLVVKCPKCRVLLYRRAWEKNLKVCQHCEHHFRLSASERIALLLDPGSFRETQMSLGTR
jgi:acetyl-CoA carboxylase carboxyl transferase subunit beta